MGMDPQQMQIARQMMRAAEQSKAMDQLRQLQLGASMQQPDPQAPPQTDPTAGQAAPSQPDPIGALTQLMIVYANNTGLDVGVQSKAIQSIAAAVAQLKAQPQEQIPAQAQFELEAKKFQMEHALKQQELHHKMAMDITDQNHRHQLEIQKAQADVALKAQAQQAQQAQAERQSQVNEQVTAHNQAMKQESNDASIEAQKKAAAQKPAPKKE